MSRPYKVHLCGGDGFGWALDEDRRQFQKILEPHVELVPLSKAQVIQCVWWESLLSIPQKDLEWKYVVCHLDNPPMVYLKDPAFHRVVPYVDCWVPRAKEAEKQLEHLGWKHCYLPYTVDRDLFNEAKEVDAIDRLRKTYKIPEGTYLVGNFFRDTEGSDLKSPKIQKGADAILEIACLLKEAEQNCHFILAGPRRFYLRHKFVCHQIPYTFIGKETRDGQDDLNINVMKRSELATLYKLLDLHLGMSRWEGGPQAVLEATACGVAMACNRVGLAMDVLSEECLFDTPHEAAQLIQDDIRNRTIRKTVVENIERLNRNHGLQALSRFTESALTEGRLYGKKTKPSLAGWKRFFVGSRYQKLADRHLSPPGEVLVSAAFEKKSASLDWLLNDLSTTKSARVKDQISPDTQLLVFDAHLVDIEVLTRHFDSLDCRFWCCFPGGMKPGDFDSSVRDYLVQASHESRFEGIFCSGQSLGDWSRAGWVNPASLVYHPFPPSVPNTESRAEDWLTLSINRGEEASVDDFPEQEEAARILTTRRGLVVPHGGKAVQDWVLLAMAMGLPVLFHESLGFQEVVQFGGASFSSPEQCEQFLTMKECDLQRLARLIRVPNSSQRVALLNNFLIFN